MFIVQGTWHEPRKPSGNLQAKMDEASCGYKASLVKVDRTVWAEMRHTYMDVSLNGGTPKTPQNDHF